MVFIGITSSSPCLHTDMQHVHMGCRLINAACCLLRVGELLFCADLSFLQDVDNGQSGRHGAITIGPLRQVGEGTKESLASVMNDRTSKCKVALMARPTGVLQQEQ